MLNKLNCKIVFGSWKAYTECINDRALGSGWLDMNDYDNVDEIYNELKKEGFTDEELEETFIQDFECDCKIFENCDYINIDRAFEILEAIDESDIGSEELEAYIEVMGMPDFEELDEKEIYLYKDYDWYDLGYYFLMESGCYQIPEYLENYIDFERYGEELKYSGFYEYSGGIVEIR